MARKVNAEGLALIKQWEAFVPFAYDDFDPPRNRRRIQAGDKVHGTLTIGYGHTGPDVKPGMTILEGEAVTLLQRDLARFEACVASRVTVPLNDNQFAALVSFAFNVGEGRFAGTTLLKKLNAGDYKSVPKELMRFVYSKGAKLNGLVNRRSAEIGLWAKGSYVASNTREAAPKSPPVVTIDNTVKTLTPLTALFQAFTSGPAQIILAVAFVAGAAYLFWRWRQAQKETEQ